MPSFRQTNEGGVQGVTVAGASGGSADGSVPYDAVSIVAAGTLIYDNTHTLWGTGGMAIEVATGVTSGVSYASWTTGITYAAAPFYTSACFYFTANPAAAFSLLAILVGGVIMCRVQLGTTGLLQGFDNAGTGGGALTNAIALNGFCRVELKLVVASATVGQHEVRLFNDPFSAVPLETKLSAASANTSTGTPTEVRAGHAQTSTASQVAFWMDDVQASTTAYPQPPPGRWDRRPSGLLVRQRAAARALTV